MQLLNLGYILFFVTLRQYGPVDLYLSALSFACSCIGLCTQIELFLNFDKFGTIVNSFLAFDEKIRKYCTVYMLRSGYNLGPVITEPVCI